MTQLVSYTLGGFLGSALGAWFALWYKARELARDVGRLQAIAADLHRRVISLENRETAAAVAREMGILKKALDAAGIGGGPAA